MLKTPCKASRRNFFCVAGSGLLAGCSTVCTAGQASEQLDKILNGKERIDIGGKGKEIIEKAYKLGYDYEKRYGGCAQCTLAALQDAIPFVPLDKGLFRAASCLDGGATPVGVQNCGSFTGAAMVMGYLCGRTRNGKFHGSTGLSHTLSHRLYQHFKKDYGTVLCRDVQKGLKGDCPKVVGTTARWATEIILKAFTNCA